MSYSGQNPPSGGMATSMVVFVVSLVANCIGIVQGVAAALLDSAKWSELAITICLAIAAIMLIALLAFGRRFSWLSSIGCGAAVLVNVTVALLIAAPWSSAEPNPGPITSVQPTNVVCLSMCPPPTTSTTTSTIAETSTTTAATTTTEQTTSEPPSSTGLPPKLLREAYVNSNAVNANASLTIKGKDYLDSLTIGCVYRSRYPAVFNATGYSKITAMIGVSDSSPESEVRQNIPCRVRLLDEAGVEIWRETFVPSEPRSVTIPLKGAGRITFECALTRPPDGYNSGSYPLGFGDALLTG